MGGRGGVEGVVGEVVVRKRVLVEAGWRTSVEPEQAVRARLCGSSQTEKQEASKLETRVETYVQGQEVRDRAEQPGGGADESLARRNIAVAVLQRVRVVVTGRRRRAESSRR